MLKRTLLILSAALMLSHQAAASTISFGIWHEFSFDDPDFFTDPKPVGYDPYIFATRCDAVSPFCPGPPSGSVFAGDPAWTFVLPTLGLLKVTDTFLAGDIFDVYDFGSLIGTTSLVSEDPFHSCDVDPDTCFADPLNSSGQFFLAPGSHSITIAVPVNPYAGGIGFLRVDPIPEPTLLLPLGAVMLGALRRIAGRSSRSRRNEMRS